MLANRGFLCRSAYTVKSTWIANVRAVEFGDIMNFYFIGKNKKPIPIGAFEIIRREDFNIERPTPAPNDFAGPVEGCALYEVVDPTFIRILDPDGRYEPDPKLGKFTGWLLRRIGPAAPATQSFLSKQPVLVRR